MQIDLTQFVESENYKNEVSSKIWDAGSFDYELILINIPFLIIEDLSVWSGKNCSEDFVIIKDTSLVVSSGIHRHFAFPSYMNDFTVKYRIRLFMIDSVLFKLTWL